MKLLIKYNIDVNASDNVSMNLYFVLRFVHFLAMLKFLVPINRKDGPPYMLPCKAETETSQKSCYLMVPMQ